MMVGAWGKADRDAAIVRAYRDERDLTLEEIGDRFNLTGARVSTIVREAGKLDPTRRSHASRRRWREGAFEGVSFEGRGRKRVWPDCPPELEADYRALRRKGYRAAEARALLEERLA